MLGEGPQSSVLVILAALNEEEGIGPTISELRQILGDAKIVVVDGNSQDRTVEVAKDLGAEVVLQRGLGKGDAMAQALSDISDREAKYIVFIDADYTYPAEHINEMMDILDRRENVGMVCGNRFNSHFDVNGMRNLFYVGNRLIAFTHTVMNGIPMRDPLTGLRVVRWKILKDWEPRSKSFDIEVELNNYVKKRGQEIVEVDIPYRPRLGEKKLKLKHGATILRRIMLETMH